MKFAIIAAGEGSRLAQEGVAEPKPLVRIGGECLIDRLIRIFTRCGADEIVVIVNNLTTRVQEHLKTLHAEVPLRMVVKTTAGSMHSFNELAPYLSDGPFCLTTVDTIFREEEFAQYIEAFRTSGADGMMAVTDYIDDESPLYVSTDEHRRITGFHDTLDKFRASEVAETSECKYISGGIYCLTPVAIEVLRDCMASGKVRMREFQRGLVAHGCRLQAYPMGKILDVDHVADIAKAEEYLNGQA
jgi:NDP-sugar pyrophosphorylase family protein